MNILGKNNNNNNSPLTSDNDSTEESEDNDDIGCNCDYQSPPLQSDPVCGV